MAGKWTVAAICGGILFISLAILIYTCFTSHQACDSKGKIVPSEGTESSQIGKMSSESAITSIFTAAEENSVTVTPSARTSILFATNSSSISPTTPPSNMPFLVTLPYKPITNTTSNDSPSNPYLVPATIQNSSSVVLTRLSTVPHAPGSVWETTSSAHNSWKNISTSSTPSNSASITAYNSSLVIISLPSSSSSSSSSSPSASLYKSTLAYAPIPYSSGSNLKNEETPINSSENGKFSTKPSTMFLGKENTSTTSRLISVLTSGVSLDSYQTERASASSERTTTEVTSTILYPVTFGVELGDKIIHTPAKCPTGYKKFEGKCRPKWGKTDTIDDESDALS